MAMSLTAFKLKDRPEVKHGAVMVFHSLKETYVVCVYMDFNVNIFPITLKVWSS